MQQDLGSPKHYLGTRQMRFAKCRVNPGMATTPVLSGPDMTLLSNVFPVREEHNSKILEPQISLGLCFFLPENYMFSSLKQYVAWREAVPSYIAYRFV